MRSVIIVHPDFDKTWPFAADHFHALWKAQGFVQFVRVADDDKRPLGELMESPDTVSRLVALGIPVTIRCLKSLSGLREAVFIDRYNSTLSEECIAFLKNANVRVYHHPTEGFWGQSVAEYALALTLCGLRRIPQLHHQMLADLTVWNYNPPNNKSVPGGRGHQFGDDANFTNGTIEGKRVRIVGAGNIASRYAKFVHVLGADVAAWDPFASEPSFHLAGSRKVWHLDEMIKDADIFAPMVPLTESTRGIVTAEHIRSLPKGCLVVLATRAKICDMPTLRDRVLADELSLAADVFDVEPLPVDDPLLGRHNVVHTPHNAGRTIDANRRWAEKLAEQFQPV